MTTGSNSASVLEQAAAVANDADAQLEKRDDEDRKEAFKANDVGWTSADKMNYARRASRTLPDGMVDAIPWMQFGVYAEPQEPGVAFKHGPLNWEVKTGPLKDHLGRDIEGRVTIYRAGHYELVRDGEVIEGDDYVLGDATDIYTPIQNRIMYDLGVAMHRDGGAKLAGAGLLNGGRQTYVLFQLPEGMLVNGRDRYDSYLFIRNGHDGGTAFAGWLTKVRVRCENTYEAAMQGKSAFRIEHYGNTTARLAAAARTIKIAAKYDEALAKWFETLVDIKITPAQKEKVQALLFGEASNGADDEPTGGGQSNIRRNQAIAWNEVLNEEVAAANGLSAYAMVQSFTGFADHKVAVRKTEFGDQRMLATFDGTIHDWKVKGLRALAKVVGTNSKPFPMMPTPDSIVAA